MLNSIQFDIYYNRCTDSLQRFYDKVICNLFINWSLKTERISICPIRWYESHSMECQEFYGPTIFCCCWFVFYHNFQSESLDSWAAPPPPPTTAFFISDLRRPCIFILVKQQQQQKRDWLYAEHIATCAQDTRHNKVDIGHTDKAGIRLHNKFINFVYLPRVSFRCRQRWKTAYVFHGSEGERVSEDIYWESNPNNISKVSLLCFMDHNYRMEKHFKHYKLLNFVFYSFFFLKIKRKE